MEFARPIRARPIRAYSFFFFFGVDRISSHKATATAPTITTMEVRKRGQFTLKCISAARSCGRKA